MLTGVIVGYDPGGDKSHGIAELRVQNGQPQALTTRTFQTAEDVIGHLENLSSIVAIGVDTLTCWGTGPGAWHPADRWLRARYVAVRNSVITPNGLFGSMALNGMAANIVISSSPRLKSKTPLQTRLFSTSRAPLSSPFTSTRRIR